MLLPVGSQSQECEIVSVIALAQEFHDAMDTLAKEPSEPFAVRDGPIGVEVLWREISTRSQLVSLFPQGQGFVTEPIQACSGSHVVLKGVGIDPDLRVTFQAIGVALPIMSGDQMQYFGMTFRGTQEHTHFRGDILQAIDGRTVWGAWPELLHEPVTRSTTVWLGQKGLEQTKGGCCTSSEHSFFGKGDTRLGPLDVKGSKHMYSQKGSQSIAVVFCTFKDDHHVYLNLSHMGVKEVVFRTV